MTEEKTIEILSAIDDYFHKIESDCMLTEVDKAIKMAINALKAQLSEEDKTFGKWILCSDRMPECEQEVLICTEKKLVGRDAYIDSIVTPAIYEDGTMLDNDSMWRWEDIDYAGWDDEEDCGIIPEGWWENRHFNPDEVYNNEVDQKVIAWMPLPEPWKGEAE